MAMGAKQLKVGMTILFNKELYRMLSVKHVTPGNLGAFVQVKMRNLRTGLQTEHKFRSTEDVERVYPETTEVEYLYADGDTYNFMDTTSYEQFPISAEILGESTQYLKPNMKLKLESFDEKPVGIELPATVSLKVVETEPFIKTATATNSYKAAKVETGATIQVPGFITEGEAIEIDTSTGEYLGRAK